MKRESGFLLVDKPKGLTSHQVVEKLRQITKIRKIGHSGTLDPLATGLLILGIGPATKKLAQFQKLDKEYLVKIRLGASSDTFDKEGKIQEIIVEKIPSLEEIKKILEGLKGEILQVPPIFSAKKIKGKRLYQLARKGIKIFPQPIKVKIYQIELLDYQWPFLEIKVLCSSGTYIRSLAFEIGERLGCKGLVEELKRTKIGNYSLKEAVPLEKITPENWQDFLRLS